MITTSKTHTATAKDAKDALRDVEVYRNTLSAVKPEYTRADILSTEKCTFPASQGGLTPRFMRITQWCIISGMTRSATYACLKAGHLRAVKQGRATLIDVPHGLAWLESLPASHPKAAA